MPTAVAPSSKSPRSFAQQQLAPTPVVVKPRAPSKPAQLEKLLDAPLAEFERLARLANQPGGPKLAQLTAVTFDRTVQRASKTMRARDAKLDAVANLVVDTLKTRKKWTVSATGANGHDLIAGQFQEKYVSTMKSFAEAYNVIDLHAPILKDQSLAIVRTRRFNEWTSQGRPQKYVDAAAELRLEFIDPKTRQLFGSGFLLTDAPVAEMAAAIVKHLDDMVVLNRRHPRP